MGAFRSVGGGRRVSTWNRCRSLIRPCRSTLDPEVENHHAGTAMGCKRDFALRPSVGEAADGRFPLLRRYPE